LVVQKEMTKHGIHPLRSVQGTIEMGEEKRMRGREGRKEGRKEGREEEVILVPTHYRRLGMDVS
jgi:hypothetical protein